jgi:hypothetical protein
MEIDEQNNVVLEMHEKNHKIKNKLHKYLNKYNNIGIKYK